jgi:hypothetical protein
MSAFEIFLAADVLAMNPKAGISAAHSDAIRTVLNVTALSFALPSMIDFLEASPH